MKSNLVTAAIMTTALWSVAAYGQDPSPADFVTQATLAGTTEVLAARTALKNSQSADVHAFAQQMIKDHSRANMRLASIAKSKGLPVPVHLDAKHRAALDSLRAQTGAAFDAAYAEQMVADHAEAVALFKSEAAAQGDADLSAFAQKTLPTLEHHKSMADALAAQHGAASPSGNTARAASECNACRGDEAAADFLAAVGYG
jgi:putative membrane protein